MLHRAATEEEHVGDAGLVGEGELTVGLGRRCQTEEAQGGSLPQVADQR